MICLSCGEAAREGAKVCGYCGTRLPAPAEESITSSVDTGDAEVSLAKDDQPVDGGDGAGEPAPKASAAVKWRLCSFCSEKIHVSTQRCPYCKQWPPGSEESGVDDPGINARPEFSTSAGSGGAATDVAGGQADVPGEARGETDEASGPPGNADSGPAAPIPSPSPVRMQTNRPRKRRRARWIWAALVLVGIGAGIAIPVILNSRDGGGPDTTAAVFVSNATWSTGPTEWGPREVVPPVLRITNDAQNGRAQIFSCAVPVFDFVIDFSGEIVSSEGELGVVFRRSDNQNYVVASFTADGRYRVSITQGGRWTTIVHTSEPWKVGELNRIHLEATGGTLTGTLNGNAIRRAILPTDVLAGDVCLMVGSWGQVTVVGEFSDIHLTW